MWGSSGSQQCLGFLFLCLGRGLTKGGRVRLYVALGISTWKSKSLFFGIKSWRRWVCELIHSTDVPRP